MMKTCTTFLIGAVLALGGSASAQSPGGLGSAQWAKAPSAEEVAKAYPAEARSMSMEGRSVAECGFAPEGRPRACAILMDEPRGYGFGDALKILTPKFQLAPSDARRKAILSIHWLSGGPVIDPPDIGPPLPSPSIPPSSVTENGASEVARTGGTPEGVSWSPVFDGRPSWERKPTSRDIDAFYPRKAKSLGVEGRTVMRCGVSATGVLRDCEVVSEEPPGLGFGEAALKTAPLFKMAPKTTDGRPVEGGWVTIPLGWRLYWP